MRIKAWKKDQKLEMAESDLNILYKEVDLIWIRYLPLSLSSHTDNVTQALLVFLSFQLI